MLWSQENFKNHLYFEQLNIFILYKFEHEPQPKF